MNPKLRARIVAGLKAIWSRRDLPGVPDAELNRMSDDSLCHLLRFWTHKNIHWDTENPPVFSEVPPHGSGRFNVPLPESAKAAVQAAIEAEAKPLTCGGSDGVFGNRIGRTFKGCGGGHLTERQSAKLGVESN